MIRQEGVDELQRLSALVEEAHFPNWKAEKWMDELIDLKFKPFQDAIQWYIDKGGCPESTTELKKATYRFLTKNYSVKEEGCNYCNYGKVYYIKYKGTDDRKLPYEYLGKCSLCDPDLPDHLPLMNPTATYGNNIEISQWHKDKIRRMNNEAS